MPIVKMAKTMRSLGFGKVLLIIADDEGARFDVPAWCAKTGNEFIGLDVKDEVMYFYVRKLV